MSVKKHTVTPGVKSGKPAPPDNFTVTPSGAGSESMSAPNLEQGSIGGSAGHEHSPTANYAKQETYVSHDIPSRVKGKRSVLPDKVQTDFNVRP